jgi:hypothetical protein
MFQKFEAHGVKQYINGVLSIKIIPADNEY